MNNLEIYIEYVLLSKLNREDPVYSRETKLNLRNDDLNIVSDISADYGKITSHALAKEVPHLVGLSDTPTRQASVVNGWDNPRYDVAIKAIQQEDNGSNTVVYIIGYTDIYAPIEYGNIPEDMEIIFNTVIICSELDGNIRPVSSFDINYDSDSNGISVHDLSKYKRVIRPYDIIDGLGHKESYGDEEGYNSINNVFSRESIPISAKDKELFASTATVLEGISIGADMVEVGHSTTDKYNTAKTMAKPPRISSVGIIRAIARLVGTSTVRSCTIEDLMEISSCEIDLKINEPADYAELENNTDINIDMFSDDNRSSTGGVSREMTAGVTVLEALTGMVSSGIISSIALTITNEDLDEPEVVLHDVQSLVDMDISQYLRVLSERLKHEVFNPLTGNGKIDLHMDVFIDIHPARAYVSMNRQAGELVYLPKSMSGVYSNMVTDLTGYEETIDGYQALVKNLDKY